MLLEKRNQVVKEKEIYNYITDDVEISSDSEEDICRKKFRWKQILTMKKILMWKFWKKFRWKKVQMMKIKYKIFSGFLFPGVEFFFFRAWDEKCRVPFGKI